MMRRLYAAPFLLFLLAFVGIPLWSVLAGSFGEGETSYFAYYGQIVGSRFYRASFATTFQVSLLTMAIGVSLALCAAIALRHRAPRVVRIALVFGNIGANFAGVPAVLAFIILVGVNGILTQLFVAAGLIDGIDIYSTGGLILIYSFFQTALATVLLVPVVASVPTEVEEAATLMGVQPSRFWLRVGLPIVGRQIFMVATLLFANAMGTYATAYTLIGTNARIVTVRIGELVAGDVFSDPALANALSVCLLLALLLPIVICQSLQRERRP